MNLFNLLSKVVENNDIKYNAPTANDLLFTNKLDLKLPDSITYKDFLVEATPLSETLKEANHPVVESNNTIVLELQKNYNLLIDFYKIKEDELARSKAETNKMKRYNRIMLTIALLSVCINIALFILTLMPQLFP